MQENGKPTKQKKRLNLKLVLLFSCALLVCMVITFSITLAYFGGSSDSMSASLYLKSPLYIDDDATKTNISLDKYMIPGVNILPTCELSLKSGTELTNYNPEAVTNALVRLKVDFAGDMASYLSVGVAYADVYKTATASGMTDANKVARLVKHSDNYWYVVADTSATSVTASSLMYVVPLSTNSGTASLMFKLQFNVATTFANDKGGKTATATIEFKAIQADFYEGSSTPLDKTIANAKKIFDSEV